MILSFTLTMPNKGSANGSWSGEHSLYVKTRSFGRLKTSQTNAQSILKNGYYLYHFGDGWTACVKIAEVTRSEANKLQRRSKGFHGYDWMIDSIIIKGEIKY